ncbi:RNA polymerase sigma factor SigJ [Pseudonocardia asaccharolytica]|uniref:RNA polymerase sigma factor SigJ n=1 Tax=Pseudonocardia asaccharolytica DSM 44247 = NBRC 16224 TaxID=1123024 RepID=A0A511CWI8_9PSEU|nr:RNA polymerase sigma factor SigJ [Pseudonocardia asaccharolytica]GEL16922.1 RNA polymerase sigma factor SigJ [Pseudonocardia asaccharolytica DSM 44247 = NBRC 16224]
MEPETAPFEQHRAHLLRIGYRITGVLADAEDAVQEAWLRFAALDDGARAGIRDLRAWLTTVVGRLCLDRLRSAAARRERYVGPWLPEPLMTSPDAHPDHDPLAAVVRDEGVRMAAMLVLERLSPPQRVAFVLHEALTLPFADIAGVLGCSEPAARQHASRARRIVTEAELPRRAPTGEQQAVLAAFADAISRADAAALVALLHPDAVLISDSDGKVRAARQPVRGAEKVVRLLLGLLRKHGAELGEGWIPLLVNGELGFQTPRTATVPPSVVVLPVSDGRIGAVYQVFNPDKLTRLAWA